MSPLPFRPPLYALDPVIQLICRRIHSSVPSLAFPKSTAANLDRPT